jgi:hypothetical protein
MVKFFPTKTPPQIASRWEKVLNPQIVKGSWTRDEDDRILAFVEGHGTKDWAKLAADLPGRTSKQCRERFKNHLDPAVQRIPWKEEDDQQLIGLHERYGNQWSLIASFFDGRTDHCIKNRWNSTVKKRLARLASGQPLIQKRGRKSKSFEVILLPDVHDESNATPDGECPVDGECPTPCTSPLFHAANAPLAFDHRSLMMVARLAREPCGGSTLAENRADFHRLLLATGDAPATATVTVTIAATAT